MIKVLRTGVHTDNRFEGYTNFEPIYGSSTLIVAEVGGEAGFAVGGRVSGGRVGGTAKPSAGGLKILVDPGHIAVAAELNELLKKEGVLPEQIDYVFITHHHLDHSSNMGAFANAKIFIGDGYVTREQPSYMVFKKQSGAAGGVSGLQSDYLMPGLPANFKIFSTPGHTLESNSYLYEENGVRYICAGDAVREDVIRVGAHTVMASRELYLKSLKQIFALADVIIPGHGRVIEGALKEALQRLVAKL